MRAFRLITTRLVYVIGAVAVLLAIGTVGFVVIEGWPVFDAFYMALITITTVGYSELHGLSPAGRVFNSFLIFFGVTTLFFAIGAMTQVIIELELGEYFGRRRMKRMIDKLENHYIICGFGRVGRSAASELQRAGAPLVVIDRSADKYERAFRAGIPVIQADSTRDQALRDAGIERARGLVAALATDADNVFLILSAKTLNPKILVAARVGEEGAEQKLQLAGADTVFAAYQHAGHQLALSLLRPHVVQFLDAATSSIGLDVELEQLRVAAGSDMAGKSLKQLQVRRDLGVIVLAIRKGDGEMKFNPPADAVLESGDVLVVMGEQDKVRNVQHLLRGVRP